MCFLSQLSGATLHRGECRDKRARFPILFVGNIDMLGGMGFNGVILAE